MKCNQTIEFKQDSILKTGIKTAQKEGYHLLDCQLTIQGICPTCSALIDDAIGNRIPIS